MGKLTLSPLIKAREDKHWPSIPEPATSGDQATACPNDKCGKMFHEPIELTVKVKDSLETYSACPHCFSRVSDPETLKISQKETTLKNLKKALDAVPPSDRKTTLPKEAKDTEEDKPAGCKHFLKYLKTRPKDAPIPDDCLTCAALMKCM